MKKTTLIRGGESLDGWLVVKIKRSRNWGDFLTDTGFCPKSAAKQMTSSQPATDNSFSRYATELEKPNPGKLLNRPSGLIH
ncbi:hypothetical protein OAF34_07120, partial [Pirellulaceae bacterium]|nr:hypothetical protein [Pirellulaceae bacterium]